VPGLRVGILGGSFNPAHDGHRHISLLALKHLGLDEVWWMVAPQNPLKPTDGMAPFDERMAGAAALANHPDINVTDIERRLGTRYSHDTLRALKACFPKMYFVWVMGADNLAQIDHWQRWQDIFETVPIAVFDRAPYSFSALAGKAARAFDRSKLRPRDAHDMATRAAPAWVYFHTRLHPGSATAIRTGRARAGRRPRGRVETEARRAL
jgi:nicotinate-nucleotide adenylyltransferase